MNRSLSLACMVLMGCAATPSRIVTTSQAVDAGGNNRLLLRDTEQPIPDGGEGAMAYDFHSLVWEVRNGDTWTEKSVLTQADFQQGSSQKRWVNELHGFDANGLAIIKVGEGRPGNVPGSRHVEYSWREWDVGKNQEVRVLRVCRDPFEPFEGHEH